MKDLLYFMALLHSFIYLACVKSLNFAGNPPLKKRDCKEIARYVSIKVFPL